MKKTIQQLLIAAVALPILTIQFFSCAQIGMPSGGFKDTAAPILIKSTPGYKELNYKKNKITLYFNEFIEIEDIQNHWIISPLPKYSPEISGGLKTISIKLKDSMMPNTTYSFDFGRSIKDINEGNVVKNLRFVFSTGNAIDSLTLKGSVFMAESGKVDSGVIVLLYRNGSDSSVKKEKPNYIARVDGKGFFMFKHLPAGRFKIYALKDLDGNKYYSSRKELFAFNQKNKEIYTNEADSIILYAYAEEKESTTSSNSEKKSTSKKIEYVTNLVNQKQDLLEPLIFTFPVVLKSVRYDSIFLTDTSFVPVANATIRLDSSRKKIMVNHNWTPENMMCIILSKGSIIDSGGLTLIKNDTIRFSTKSNTDYGSLTLTFKNIELEKHPVLQFMDGDIVKWKYKITSNVWTNNMMIPGDYEVRLLMDDNNNEKWDAGNYLLQIQPEKAITLTKNITIKADEKNEMDFVL